MLKRTIAVLLISLIYTAGFGQNLNPSDADSKVSFIIKNMGLDVDGSLKGLKGKIAFDPKSLKSSLFDVTVDVNTINTNNTRRDAHLKRADFFDAEKYPVIGIKTTSVSAKGKDRYTAKAILTMHGVSKNIQFDFVAQAQANGYRFTGGFTLDRLAYGIGKNSMTMGDEVKVNLDVVAKKN